MSQSGAARCAFQSPYLTHERHVRAVIIACADDTGPLRTAGLRSSWLTLLASRIDFAPPMCALPHSTPHAVGPMSGFSGTPRTTRTELKGKPWESLRVRLQSSPVDRSGMASPPRSVRRRGRLRLHLRPPAGVLDEAAKRRPRRDRAVKGRFAIEADLDRAVRDGEVRTGTISTSSSPARGWEVDAAGRDHREAWSTIRFDLNVAGYALHRPEGAAADARRRFDHPDRVERATPGRPGSERTRGRQGRGADFARSWANDLKAPASG